MSAKHYSVGYWLRSDEGFLTSWHCEAEQYVFDFMALQPPVRRWCASLTTAPGDYWEGGYPL